MNGNEDKTNLKGKIIDKGFWALLGAIPAGIILCIIGFVIEDMHIVLFGIFIFCTPFGIMRFGMIANETRESKLGFFIFLGIIVVIGIGLGYLYAINYFS